MHNAAFGRSRYLAGNMLELQTLAKLYGIPPMGNPKMMINWVDALVEYLPEAKVVTWGALRDKQGFILQSLKMSLLETLKFVDNDHNPNAAQLAILARLIELRPRYHDLGHLFDEKGLKAEERLCTEVLWKIYQARQREHPLLEETQIIWRRRPYYMVGLKKSICRKWMLP
ncbi:hypothetical protein CAL7102_03722 [Dulcicalothrix desertica PCC 7102]|nr:hypothetical protein CAL7102_03722 [Dulcicalothrix desertica PCC 7102]